VLCTELYARDGSPRQDRPYTVTETLPGVREESPPDGARERIFFLFVLARRTTQWERGAEPMTQFAFSSGYDAYGFATQQLSVAVPRGRDPFTADPSRPFLATYATTEFARRDDATHYLVDRVARATNLEVVNDGHATVSELRDGVLAGRLPIGVSLRVIGHTRTYFDGDAFV
jgi:hypothetical protein